MKEIFYLMGYEEPLETFLTNHGIRSRLCINDYFRIVFFDTYDEAKEKANEIYKETGVYMGVSKTYR